MRSARAKSSSLFFCLKHIQNNQEHSYYLVNFHTFFWSLFRCQIITYHLLSQLSHHIWAKKDIKERMTRKRQSVYIVNHYIAGFTVSRATSPPPLLTSIQPRTTIQTCHNAHCPGPTSTTPALLSHTTQAPPPLADSFTFTLSMAWMCFHLHTVSSVITKAQRAKNKEWVNEGMLNSATLIKKRYYMHNI